MEKSKAIQLFGSGVRLAEAMGVTKQFVSQLPEDLPQKYSDWITGAAIRMGFKIREIKGMYSKQ